MPLLLFTISQRIGKNFFSHISVVGNGSGYGVWTNVRKVIDANNTESITFTFDWILNNIVLEFPLRQSFRVKIFS